MSELSESRVAAEQAVRTAVLAQLAERDAHHLDVEAWGETLEVITRRLAELAATMSGQVRDYGARRLLRDDEDADPAARLAMAAGHLDDLHRALTGAHQAAIDVRSEIAHIAVDVDPDAVALPRRGFDHEVMPYWPGLAARPPLDDDTE